MKRFLLALGLLASAMPTFAADPVVVGKDYVPTDKDERGLWDIMNEEERKLKTSAFVMRDPALNAYVRQVLCKTVGPQCADIRLYLIRTPYFNAAMGPNGMMLVNSGLFLRTRNEAQLAAILGHEFTHYTGRHSVRLWKNIRAKTDAAAWLSMIPVAGWAAAGVLTVAQLGILGSLGAFSRDMEREADSGSISLLAKGGYDPMAASRIWGQLRDEMDATALARGKKSQKDKSQGMMASHPSTLERMTDLKALAEKTPVSGTPTLNRAEYRVALAPHWASFVDDQIKLNDFGATEMLLAELGKDGWTSELLFARGELYRTRGKPDDLVKAAEFHGEAVKQEGAPVEAWRGLGLAQLRSGKQAEGQAALKTYLEKRPDASDRAMIAMLAGGTK
jgi:beta-barrel assembly-enhancing protease